MNEPAHRLNAPCPDCADPLWLHNERGCLKLRRPNTRDANTAKRAPLTKCRCRKTAKAFA